MVFILGYNFPESRLVKVALQSFYGIGPSISRRIMARYYIHPTMKVGALTDKQVLDLTADLSKMHIENDLRRQVQGNIQKLLEMGTYRGKRHLAGLPVRGQSTKTQTNTARKLNRIERRG